MSHFPVVAARQGTRSWRLMLSSLVVVAAAAAAWPTWAQPHGPGGEGGHAPMMWGGSPRHIDRLLDSVNATDAQRAQIKQITAAAAVDMKAQRESGRALREQAMKVFTAPVIDANAAEQLRLQMLAQHDKASQRTTQVMLQVAQVLTPEQRAKLGEQMAKRAAAMQDRMKRHHGDGAAPRS